MAQSTQAIAACEWISLSSTPTASASDWCNARAAVAIAAREDIAALPTYCR
jgi:hypothetical protein